MKKQAVNVQKYLKRFIYRRQVKREIQQIKDEDYTKKLQAFIKQSYQSNESLINEAAMKIQTLYHRLKYKKELKELR